MNKKIIAAAIGCLGLIGSGTASALVVGGVDFGTPAAPAIETTTLAETLITGNNQLLTAYGQVNTVNGEISYAGANRLYFVAEGYLSANFSAGSADFTGGVINFYLGASALIGNLTQSNSVQNIFDIKNLLGSPWLTVAGSGIGTFSGADPITLHAVGTLIGQNISFNGAGLLDVTGGLADVVAFFDNNQLGTATDTADIALTTDAANVTLNANDNLTGCQDGTAAAGQFCIAGSATAQSPAGVPEPDVLALIGLGLLGFGAVQRKNKTA